MEVPTKMNPVAWLRKHLDGDGDDVVREMIKAFAEQLMAAEADVLCGAGWGERSEERVNRRNGYRARTFDTRAGTIELDIPKLRTAATSRTGCSSLAGGPSAPSPRWWPSATWRACPPGGWKTWPEPWASSGCRSLR